MFQLILRYIYHLSMLMDNLTDFGVAFSSNAYISLELLWLQWARDERVVSPSSSLHRVLSLSLSGRATDFLPWYLVSHHSPSQPTNRCASLRVSSRSASWRGAIQISSVHWPRACATLSSIRVANLSEGGQFSPVRELGCCSSSCVSFLSVFSLTTHHHSTRHTFPGQKTNVTTLIIY